MAVFSPGHSLCVEAISVSCKFHCRYDILTYLCIMRKITFIAVPGIANGAAVVGQMDILGAIEEKILQQLQDEGLFFDSTTHLERFCNNPSHTDIV